MSDFDKTNDDNPDITDRCYCGADCFNVHDSEQEPCWGSIKVIAEEYGDDWCTWVHACDGHEDVYDGGKYHPKPVKETE